MPEVPPIYVQPRKSCLMCVQSVDAPDAVLWWPSRNVLLCTMHPDLLRQEHMLPSRSLSWRLCAIATTVLSWRGADAEMLHGVARVCCKQMQLLRTACIMCSVMLRVIMLRWVDRSCPDVAASVLLGVDHSLQRFRIRCSQCTSRQTCPT
jgi:hypothetical protein